jgi:outer membrane protein OmpA-like peptidoglycan-associated protein
LSTALLNALFQANVKADDFSGAYIGAGVGSNSSSATSLPSKKQLYPNLRAGYNWDRNGFLLGAEGFVDAHSDAYSGKDAGLDARLGFIQNKWIPYVRLGFAGTNPGARFHGGIGMEYRLSDRWSFNADWTTDSKAIGIRTYKNNNFTIGLNLRLGNDSGKAVPQVADAIAVKAAAAKSAPTYQTLFTDKPVTLEGARFAFGKAQLNPSASEQLDLVVQFALDYKGTRIAVTGYTDNVGNEKQNLELSAARAEAVKAYLVSKGVAPERISTKGLGSANPVADNNTAEGRTQNRRVEINSVIKEAKKVLVN